MQKNPCDTLTPRDTRIMIIYGAARVRAPNALACNGRAAYPSGADSAGYSQKAESADRTVSDYLH